MSATLNVPSISCSHCKATIETAVAELTGVAMVQVDIEGRQVEVDFDPTQVSLEEITAAIDEAGYEVVT